MADISKIKLPDNSSYDIKDETARNANPASASVSSGSIIFKNSSGTTLFSVALPLYDGSVT